MLVGLVYRLEYDPQDNPCFDIDIVSDEIHKADDVIEVEWAAGAQAAIIVTISHPAKRTEILIDDYINGRDLCQIDQDLIYRLERGLDRCFLGAEFQNKGQWYTVEKLPPPRLATQPLYSARCNTQPRTVWRITRSDLVKVIRETQEQTDKHLNAAARDWKAQHERKARP